jgi:hypothetical protein
MDWGKTGKVNSTIVHEIETSAVAGAGEQEAGAIGDFLELRVDGIESKIFLKVCPLKRWINLKSGVSR